MMLFAVARLDAKGVPPLRGGPDLIDYRINSSEKSIIGQIARTGAAGDPVLHFV